MMQSTINVLEPSFSFQRFNLLGLPFDAVTLDQAANHVESCIESNTLCFVSTPNLNFTVMAQNDSHFYRSVIESDLVVADGMPLIWVAKLLGLPLTERVAGSDLFEHLSSQPRQDKIRVFFFGGEEGIAQEAHIALNKNSQGMESCGFYDPGFVSIEDMSSNETINYINSCNPDFIVVALGAKKGQQWIMRNRHLLKAPVISHLGAVINFVAGNLHRAPEKWQKYGLEWLWRIKQEPKLYKRYVNDGLRFIAMIISQVVPLAMKLNKHKSSESLVINAIEQVEDKKIIKLDGELTSTTISSLKSELAASLMDKQNVILDMENVNYIDQSVIAFLMTYQNKLNKIHKDLLLSKVSDDLMSLLTYSSVLKRFTLL